MLRNHSGRVVAAMCLVARVTISVVVALAGAASLAFAQLAMPRRPEPVLISRTMDLMSVADRVFAPWNSTAGPGCAVAVAQGGKMLLERGYGMADLTDGIAIRPSTILESGSVAKQFTATAVLLLMQDGKLSLDDDARRYIPELPIYGRALTVRHLLTHTSGLREWSNLVDWQGWPRGTRVHTQSDVFELITHQKALNYPVGDYYSYTNSGFLLLRTLVERVCGKPFAQFTQERIFRPLGLTNTSWRDDYTRVVPGLAQAYVKRADGWHLDMPYDNVIAAGGLLTTVGDWLTWNDALTRRTLGTAWGDSITRRMTLTNGTQIQYALGLVVTSYRGLREISHSGSTAGYSTFLARYPERDDLSIAVMCNASGAPATAYAHGILDGIYLDLPRAAAFDTVAAGAVNVAPFAGVYRDSRTNTAIVLESSGGQLRLQNGAVLRPLVDGTFMNGTTRLRFDTAPRGEVRDFRRATADADSLSYARVADAVWTPSPADVGVYAGKYRSEEIGVTFDVRAVQGLLTISPRAGVVDTLRAQYRDPTRDAFVQGGDAVWFTRDQRGRVNAMHFGSARVWDFTSVRVP